MWFLSAGNAPVSAQMRLLGIRQSASSIGKGEGNIRTIPPGPRLRDVFSMTLNFRTSFFGIRAFFLERMDHSAVRIHADDRPLLLLHKALQHRGLADLSRADDRDRFEKCVFFQKFSFRFTLNAVRRFLQNGGNPYFSYILPPFFTKQEEKWTCRKFRRSSRIVHNFIVKCFSERLIQR